jgi:hypothetical protein
MSSDFSKGFAFWRFAAMGMTASVSSGAVILIGESRVPGDKVGFVTYYVTQTLWHDHCCHRQATVRSVYCRATCER